jgi:hypothetical protein
VLSINYNRRHGREGDVLQNRFKSILIDAEAYLLELVRYIHLNPIRANMLKNRTELDRYRWTGHAGLLGRHQQSWQETKEILCLVARQTAKARRNYRQFIRLGIELKGGMDLSGGGLIRGYGVWEAIQAQRKEHEVRFGDERILGASDFVEAVLNHDKLRIRITQYINRRCIVMTTAHFSFCHEHA